MPAVRQPSPMARRVDVEGRAGLPRPYSWIEGDGASAPTSDTRRLARRREE